LLVFVPLVDSTMAVCALTIVLYMKLVLSIVIIRHANCSTVCCDSYIKDINRLARTLSQEVCLLAQKYEVKVQLRVSGVAVYEDRLVCILCFLYA
jgi:hypothetical protein